MPVKWVVVGLQGTQAEQVERIRLSRGCPRAVLLRELISAGLKVSRKVKDVAEWSDSIERRFDALEARVEVLESPAGESAQSFAASDGLDPKVLPNISNGSYAEGGR